MKFAVALVAVVMAVVCQELEPLVCAAEAASVVLSGAAGA